MTDYTKRINDMLELSLQPGQPGQNQRLVEAMRYSVLGGGKRLRPKLVYATGQALDVADSRLDAPAAAVECIHAYSLVHDDLPAMDDDDLRRGQATTHVAFDPATAILAGDALQARAFEMLAGNEALDCSAGERSELIRLLAEAAGWRGMVSGQMSDMAAEGQALTQEQLEHVHARKTGALLRACVLMPAALCPTLSRDSHAALDRFATHIGLAFQVRDDVIDVESSTETLGKTQGADAAHHKATYPALMGLDAAKAYAERLVEDACAALAEIEGRIDGDTDALEAIARAIVERES
ncbi:(2E,6E)-farnesyl diphosphate synthase [Salinisphaera orenii]|uniref:(2E,6E)-farnesyl diphosphate synthase n=1 Tax=Salinisphaera orenii TaxID=856731 RepID=UPI00296EB417